MCFNPLQSFFIYLVVISDETKSSWIQSFIEVVTNLLGTVAVATQRSPWLTVKGTFWFLRLLNYQIMCFSAIIDHSYFIWVKSVDSPFKCHPGSSMTSPQFSCKLLRTPQITDRFLNLVFTKAVYNLSTFRLFSFL